MQYFIVSVPTPPPTMCSFGQLVERWELNVPGGIPTIVPVPIFCWKKLLLLGSEFEHTPMHIKSQGESRSGL